MKKLLCLAAMFALFFGCSKDPKADEVVPVDQVPANVMAVAKKELPDITFDTVYKMKVDGKEAYELKGKNKQGKTREVEVSIDGEVLEVE